MNNSKLLMTLIAIISLSGCIKKGDFPTEDQKEEAKQIAVDHEKQLIKEKEESVNRAKNLVNDFIFVKNKESNLCFGYKEHLVFSGRYITTNPIVVQVPCENVEKILK